MHIRVNYQINTFALKAASGGRRGREDLVRDVGREGDERIADLQRGCSFFIACATILCGGLDFQDI